MSDWISVEDRLPEMKEIYTGSPKRARVIGFTGHYVCEVRYEETYAKRIANWYQGERRQSVTHWMPLPDTPKETA
jgi:uncharacterized protein YkuJ